MRSRDREDIASTILTRCKNSLEASPSPQASKDSSLHDQGLIAPPNDPSFISFQAAHTHCLDYMSLRVLMKNNSTRHSMKPK